MELDFGRPRKKLKNFRKLTMVVEGDRWGLAGLFYHYYENANS